MATEYKWNCPVSVKKEAKYRVKQEKDKYVVGVTYKTQEGEYWTPTIDSHPKLVQMVNAVKMEINDSFGGAFYINEYRQVIVPTINGYFYAGEYNDDLIFELEGRKISGRAFDKNGDTIAIGGDWDGGLMGIPYILCAGGDDIKFEMEIRQNVWLRKKLSQTSGALDTQKLARRLCNVIGDYKGGRFYINEFREMFKPKTNDATKEVIYIYLGSLKDSDPWFSKPKFDQE